ncbi:ClpXP protease specificity-enhancing factor [Lonsdalea quercina]|uniref:ClpXP protease specificity-enhancing factor n=1 Tax=Lonsdalea quercina TaxID=71657 RepID=UPI00397664FD
MALSQLSPRRPYLLRAFYDWLLDNQLTPHLVVDVSLPGVQVPMEFARDGQIVLNIAPLAVGNLELADDLVRFNARFGGVPRQVMVPMAAVMAIYARENGAGTMFEPEPAYEAGEGADDALVQDDEPHKPSLRTVDDVETAPSGNETPDDEPPSPPRGGRPSLRVVK